MYGTFGRKRWASALPRTACSFSISVRAGSYRGASASLVVCSKASSLAGSAELVPTGADATGGARADRARPGVPARRVTLPPWRRWRRRWGPVPRGCSRCRSRWRRPRRRPISAGRWPRWSTRRCRPPRRRPATATATWSGVYADDFGIAWPDTELSATELSGRLRSLAGEIEDAIAEAAAENERRAGLRADWDCRQAGPERALLTRGPCVGQTRRPWRPPSTTTSPSRSVWPTPPTS